MPAVVVVGAQWGDEAKGKIVDLLAQRADLVVRYAGGSNAGHTVAVGDLLVKLHLIPSGILNPNTRCVISDGVVIDPSALVRELRGLAERGISTANLRVSPNAHVVMPYHKEIDRLDEERKGNGKIGTTMQGVGPAYEDKARRVGIRMMDLIDPDRLSAAFDQLLPDKDRLIRAVYGGEGIDQAGIRRDYEAFGEELRPYVASTWAEVNAAVRAGEYVVFEGAQGTMLDIDYGTYPYVTSSHPIAGGACLGTGIGPRHITDVIGVCKAYTTRVGAGAFPTEQDNEVGQRIRERGNEYGTTTGRPRRIGWLDIVGLRYACRVNGLDCLAITLLDVLSGLDEVPLCTGYEVDGRLITELPADGRVLNRAVPVYEHLPGWSEEIGSVKSWEQLPANAQAYVRRIEALLETPVGLVSVGRRRDQTIILQPALFGSV